MIVLRVLLLTVVIASHVTMSAHGQSPANAVGCWTISFTRWSPSPGGDTILYQPLPDTVRLSAERWDSSYFQATRRPNIVPELNREFQDSLRVYWRPLSNDSIEIWFPIWWSTGFRAHLQIRGKTLRGRAWVYIDYDPYETPYSDVRGARCGGA